MYRAVSVLSVVGVVLVACSSSSDEASNELLPPAPSEGQQLKFEAEISAATETEKCRYFQVGPEDLNISKIEARYAQGVHHMALWQMIAREIPTTDFAGNPIQPGATFDCPTGADFTKVLSLGALAQTPSPKPLAFPAGTALKVKAGTVMLWDVHYVNGTASPIKAEARVNFHTIPASEVRTEAGVMRLYNPMIHVAPGSPGRARMACPVPADVTLMSAMSHMHWHGTGFNAQLLTPNAPPRSMYTNTESRGVDQASQNIALKTGQAVDFWCDYLNQGTSPIIHGPTTNDEMCIFVGFYFPKDPRFENCSDGTPGNDGFAAEWIGNGKMKCGEAMGCIFGSKPMQEDRGESFYKCVVNACPGASKPLSSFVRCSFSKGYGKCAQCQGLECQKCIQEACGKEIGECTSAQQCE